MNKTSVYSKIGSFIVAAPIIAWWAEYTLVTPVPLYYRYGEIVTYFIDSLAVFNGATYSYIDHPGTPVSIIGSILLALTYPFTTGPDFTLYHLSHPLIFVTLTNIFLTLSFIISALYFQRVSRSTLTRMPLIASLFVSLMYFFLHTQSFDGITLWNHNPFAFPFGMPLLLLLFFMIKDNRALGTRQLLLLGFLGGAFSAVQFFFIVWPICFIITIFIFYRMIKETMWTALKAGFLLAISAIVGFLTATLPIIAKLPDFFRWIINVAASKNRYDQGGHQFFSWKELLDGFSNLNHTQPVLYQAAAILIIIFLLLVLIRNNNTPPQFGLSALGLGLAAQTVFLTLMFIREPGHLYGLSIAATLPVLALIDLKLLEQKLDHASLPKYDVIYGIVIAFLLIFACIKTFSNLKNAITNYRNIITSENRMYADADKFISGYAKTVGRDPVIIHTPDAVNECAALLFGRSYARLDIDAQLSQICPNQYYMDYWIKRVIINDKHYYLMEMDWDLLIVGKSYLYRELKNVLKKGGGHEIAPGYFIVENKK